MSSRKGACFPNKLMNKYGKMSAWIHQVRNTPTCGLCRAYFLFHSSCECIQPISSDDIFLRRSHTLRLKQLEARRKRGLITGKQTLRSRLLKRKRNICQMFVSGFANAEQQERAQLNINDEQSSLQTAKEHRRVCVYLPR